jgi:hypothetical protein
MMWYLNCSEYNKLSVFVTFEDGLNIHIQYANKFPSFLLYDQADNSFVSNVEPVNTATVEEIPTSASLTPLYKRIGGYMNNGKGINFIEFDMFAHVEQQTTPKKVLMRQPCNVSDKFVGFYDDELGVISWVAH